MIYQRHRTDIQIHRTEIQRRKQEMSLRMFENKKKPTQTRADEHNKEMIPRPHSTGNSGEEKRFGV